MKTSIFNASRPFEKRGNRVATKGKIRVRRGEGHNDEGACSNRSCCRHLPKTSQK